MQNEIVLEFTLDYTKSLAELIEIKPSDMGIFEFYQHIISVARLRGIEPQTSKNGFELVIPTAENFKSDLKARILDIKYARKCQKN